MKHPSSQVFYCPIHQDIYKIWVLNRPLIPFSNHKMHQAELEYFKFNKPKIIMIIIIIKKTNKQTVWTIVVLYFRITLPFPTSLNLKIFTFLTHFIPVWACSCHSKSLIHLPLIKHKDNTYWFVSDQNLIFVIVKSNRSRCHIENPDASRKLWFDLFLV